MEYKGYFIKPYEQEPGEWRVRVVRTGAVPLGTYGREKLERVISDIVARTAVAAATKAIETVDAAFVSRPERKGKEKFWRLRQADRAER